VRSVAVDSSGNVYVGTSDTSMYMLDASGNQVWNYMIDTNSQDSVNSVAVDSRGNVYAGTYGAVYKH